MLATNVPCRADGRRPGIADVRADGRQPRTERPSARAALSDHSRTGCHGGLSESVPADEVDAATVLSHTPSGRSRRIRYWRSGVARTAGAPAGNAASTADGTSALQSVDTCMPTSAPTPPERLPLR